MLVKTETYVIPEYFIIFLEYGYDDNLTDKEVELIQHFIDKENLKSCYFSYSEHFFSWHNDVTKEGATCVECRVYRDRS